MSESPPVSEGIAFLKKLRPGGPWMPTAIAPDGPTKAITAHTADQVEDFVRQHEGNHNIYYGLNPTRTAINKKARKIDIAAIEYIPIDLDPRAGETPEAAKARYLEQLNGAFEPKPAFLIDSGNGLNGAVRLNPRIELGEPVNGKFTAEDQAKIAKTEAIAKDMMIRLGSVAGTQNIDRILRLPGTINLPNAKKRGEGRVACPTKLLWFNDTSYSLDALSSGNGSNPPTKAQGKPGTSLIGDSGLDETGSGYGWRFMRDCHTKGMTYEQARAAILADQNEAGKWARRVDERQLERAFEHSKPPPGAKLPLIAELGSKLWGPATANGKEYRFGGDQSKVIDPIKGIWFDFAANKGGGIRELMKKVEIAGHGQSNVDDVVAVCAADVVMRPLDWIWHGHLLRGAQELMSGLPDLGKSQVQIGLVACVTARLLWPDGAKAVEPMNVIMLTAEDTADQVVKPRLIAAGADPSRVTILKYIKTDERTKRQFLLAEDLDRLERLVAKIGGVGLVTLDPITAYMGSKTDSHRATDVRAQLGPLKDFAERLNIAVSTITHPAKQAGQRAIDHFIASQAFIAACRIGHLCIPEMEEAADGQKPTGRTLLTTPRHAHSEPMPTLVYRKEIVAIDDTIKSPRVTWDGEINITADAAVAAASGNKSDQQLKAQAFLRELLKDGKPVPYKEIEKAAEAKGFTEKQLRTAREKLGIHSDKESGKMGGQSLWQLPNPSEGKYHY
jgi:hypothetical protein